MVPRLTVRVRFPLPAPQTEALVRTDGSATATSSTPRSARSRTAPPAARPASRRTVVGRAHADPSQMKPSPRPIFDAVRTLKATPGSCVLVGDSLSDIDAARAAEVPVIG
jgi:beta-phosphoglucomutase-like phosphatase (HAD superfamily)